MYHPRVFTEQGFEADHQLSRAPQRHLILRGFDHQLPLFLVVDAGDVVLLVHGIEHFDRLAGWRRQLRRRVVVREGDPRLQTGLHDVAEYLLQRGGIVRHRDAVVRELGDDHLGHEGLEPEALVRRFTLANPPLHQANHLGKVKCLLRPALADEGEMQRDAGQDWVTAVKGKQVTAVVRVALVLHRHDVHVQAAHRVLDADGMVIDLDLVRLHLRIRLADACGEPLQQVGFLPRRLRRLHVERHVDVVEGLERGAFGQAARQQRLDEAVVRVVGRVIIQLLAQPAHLVAVILRVLPLEVDGLVREFGDVGVPDFRAGGR